MKNRTLLWSILSLIFSVILISCDDNEGEKYSIELDKSAITIDAKGGEEVVELIANGEWEVKDVPEWLSVNPVSGENSTEIAITATENKEITRRKASLIFTRGDVNKTLDVNQLGLTDLGPFIELSKSEVSMNVGGDDQKIELTTNRSWVVQDVPDWITVNPISGDKSAEITIRVGKNIEPEGRQAILSFVNGDVKETLKVHQYGVKDYIRFPGLPIFFFSSMRISNAEYTLETQKMFINPSIKDKIYLGNLISHNAQSNTNIPEFTGYTFNPITISTAAIISGEIMKTYIPSWTDQDAFARQIIEQRPRQSESFVADNGTAEFYSYKQLYAVGIANMGVKLDEVVSGSSFVVKEMVRKYGLIFSFKQTLFSLTMDLPDEKLVKEELKEIDKAKGVSYVATVSYGKVGLLIVESDTNSEDVRIAINKVIANKVLSQRETNLIETVDVSYVYFDNNNELKAKKGKLDAINAYKNALEGKDADNIYPVGFELADYFDHSTSTISFSFKRPK